MSKKSIFIEKMRKFTENDWVDVPVKFVNLLQVMGWVYEKILSELVKEVWGKVKEVNWGWNKNTTFFMFALFLLFVIIGVYFFYNKTPNKFLVKMKKIKNKFVSEREISDFFEKNLESIFPTLELLATEWKFEKGVIDAVCWNPQEKIFVFLEYRSIKHHEQNWKFSCYLDMLAKSKEIRNKLMKLLNKNNLNFIKWDETKLFFIVPKFPIYKNLESEKNIWIEYEWYDNDGEEFLFLESKNDWFSELVRKKPMFMKCFQ